MHNAVAHVLHMFLAALVGDLVKEYAVVIGDPLNAVLMEVTHVADLPVYTDDDKFAGLVAVIFIFDCLYDVYHSYIVAHQAYFVNTILG